jgi:hypothetical protein
MEKCVLILIEEAVFLELSSQGGNDGSILPGSFKETLNLAMNTFHGGFIVV